ncbi:MAG: MFS transporter [Tepidiformaceae bacterium]
MSLASRIQRHMPATRHREFRALWASSTASSIALWTLLLGNAWIVYKLSDSSLWVGVATFASMAPYFVAPLAGVIADRLERRRLGQIARFGSFVSTMALFVVALSGLIAVWIVVVVAFVQGLLRSVQTAADQSLLPSCVPPEDIGNAVALSTMSQQGSRAVGPILAGPLLATIGVQGAYGIAAAFALIAFASMTRLRVRSYGGVASLSNVVQSLGEGLNYVRSTGPVLAVFALVFLHCSLTMSFDAMLPGFAENQLHSPSGGFTLMTLGVGIGALVGTFVLSVAVGTKRGPLYFLMGIGSGIAPILMAVSMSVIPATASATLMGASQAMFMALSAMFLQETVPDAVRGRVMSLYLMSAGGIMAIANLGFGTAADRWGAPALFWIPGSIFVVAVLASAFMGSNLRRMYRTGRMGEVAAAA